MNPGLYVLVPLGIHAADPLPSAIPLAGETVFMAFDCAWRQEAKAFLSRIRDDRSGASDEDIANLGKASYCLVRSFAPPGRGGPIGPAIYGEGRGRRRVRGRYDLAAEWLRSFACLLAAGPAWLGCSDWWFGLQLPGPNSTRFALLEVHRVGWHGRIVHGEQPAGVDAAYWGRLKTIADTVRKYPNSRLAFAAEAFARATFSSGDASELLWFCTALECMFSPSRGAEVSHRLCEAAASFVERPGQSRVQMYRRLKRGYDLRSQLVHGDPKFWEEDLDRILPDLEEVVRRVLQKALLHKTVAARLATPAKHSEYLLDLVLGRGEEDDICA